MQEGTPVAGVDGVGHPPTLEGTSISEDGRSPQVDGLVMGHELELTVGIADLSCYEYSKTLMSMKFAPHVVGDGRSVP